MHSLSDRLAPRRCLKTLNCTVGEWFCPRCRSELELDSSNEPMHSSLVPTRLMNHEDCYRSLAAALGMPPAQSDCCDMFRPVWHLESQSAVHNDCTALSYANCTSTVSNCISCAVLYCTVLYCAVLYCTVLYCTPERSLISVATMLHVVGPPMGWGQVRLRKAYSQSCIKTQTCMQMIVSLQGSRSIMSYQQARGCRLQSFCAALPHQLP